MAVKEDVFPTNDDEFDTFQSQFVSVVSANPATYGVTPDDVTALKAAQAVWVAKFPAHTKAHADAVTATHAKDVARTGFEAPLRAAAHKVNSTAGKDNSVRVAAGLHPRDHVQSTIGAPTTRPLGRVETRGNHTLVLHFVDEATPTKTAKPHGVHGAQVYTHVGDPAPADWTGFTFMALDTRTPYVDVHPAADAGKTAYYMLRWANAKGETGPWSDVISAKIPI
jgi:hypothetical protein